MEPYKDLPIMQGASAHVPMRTGISIHHSPQAEFVGFDSDLGDPADEPEGWHPLGWVANKAQATAKLLKDTGNRIIDQVVSEAEDLGSTVYAAATGQPPAKPGPLFEMASGIAGSIFEKLPEPVQKKLSRDNQSQIAGYITLADGRRIPVPKYQDPQATGERAQTDVALAALRKANADAAYNTARVKLQQQAQQTTNDQWAKTFALQQRAAAQREAITDLQIRAGEYALEQETSSPAQRALWGRPSTLEPEKATKTKRILAIGSGLPGGILIG